MASPIKRSKSALCGALALILSLGACCGAQSTQSIPDTDGDQNEIPTSNITITQNSSDRLRVKFTDDQGVAHNVLLSPSDHYDNATTYDKQLKNNNYYAASFVEGIDVNVASYAFYNRSDGSLYDAGYDLDGNPTAPPVTGLFSYRGYYTASFARAGDYSTQATPIVIEVNFDAATLTGFDVPYRAVVRIDGVINGTTHSGSIVSPQGTVDYQGAFYGANANEIAGGFANGGISGGFYGLFDQDRTDAIN